MGDYNNDGHPDVFLTSKRTGENTLYVNQGDGTFSRTNGDFGPTDGNKSWGAKWVDYDNDGDLDLVVAESSDLRLFENRDGRLVERELAIEPKMGQYSDMAFADYDGDGYQDMALLTPSRQYLYESRETGHNWLRLTFEGIESNRQGFGATVRVETRDDTIYREYTGDSGTLFSNGYGPLHVGVGDAQTVDVHVEWPSGQTTRQRGVETNQTVIIEEGDDTT